MEENDNKIDLLLDAIKSFRAKILKIRNMCEDTNFKTEEAKPLLNEGILDLIEIKNLNEIVQINCENKKDECEQVQEDLGKENLVQKKYEYHLDLINNDIFTNKLLPKLPESDKVIIEEGNKNKIEMEAFNNILLGRKRLDKTLKDLKEEKKKNEISLKNKLSYIKDIPKYIEMIEKETNKTKKLFNDSKT